MEIHVKEAELVHGHAPVTVSTSMRPLSRCNQLQLAIAELTDQIRIRLRRIWSHSAQLVDAQLAGVQHLQLVDVSCSFLQLCTSAVHVRGRHAAAAASRLCDRFRCSRHNHRDRSAL